ncbi:TipJ family phage tail tip protein, partial [Vibrio crassostreae]|uniref:TipJ family phage tail tip protein n=1 Tax=Vibrio crassostreae TaxID=246167 RepID=UPI001B31528C
LHSVTFDGTPVAKQDGQLNFRGAEVVERVGTEDQIPVVGFESISLTESVGVELEDTQEWVSRQVADGFSRVRVFLRYPNGLYRYSSKGKYESWDMNYDIEVSLDDSDWLSMVQVRSSNRTQKSFDRVHYIENPNPDRESSFYIRCRRARGAGNERETGTL